MEQQESDREVTIADVLRRGWRYRGLFVILPILSAAIALAILMAQGLNLRNPIVYYITLKGIEDGKYPNDTQFAPTDLLIPEVIASVAQQFGFKDRAALRDAFQVQYGSLLEDGVNSKYRQLLAAAKNASATEIGTINAAYADEIARTVKSGVRIDFDYVSLGIDKKTGEAIAAALPEAWTTIYPKLFKIIVDTELQDVTVSRSVVGLDDTASLLSTAATLKNLRNGLTIISQDNRINSIATTAGNNGANLIQDLERFSTQYFDPLFHSADSRNPVSETHVRRIEFELANQQRQLAGLTETIRDLQNFRSSKQNTGVAQPQQPPANGTGVQLNDSGIAEIAGLVERATLADYLREVLDQRQLKTVALSELQLELAALTNPLPASLDSSFRAAATEQFKTLVDQYSELLIAARARLTESMAEMYVPASSPKATGSIVPPRFSAIICFSILIGLLLAALAALVLPFRKQVVVATLPHRNAEAIKPVSKTVLVSSS